MRCSGKLVCLSVVAIQLLVAGRSDAAGRAMAWAGPSPAPQSSEGSFPPDPSADIPWSAPGGATLPDVESAFNRARLEENSQTGAAIPPLALPDAQTWSRMTDTSRAQWLINRERTDRGVQPLDGAEINVGGVAQDYARYLLDHNVFSHTADGRDPYQRLDASALINRCHDPLPVVENLAVLGGSSPDSFPFPLERAVYAWLYEDAAGDWWHRRAILWYPYIDNGGAVGSEGFIGLGVAAGGPYQGPFTHAYPWAEIIVLNVFDPCAAWPYLAPRLYIPLAAR